MSSCPEIDTLTTLATLDDDPEATLRHVLECDACRAVLTDVAALRRLAGAAILPRGGFTDTVMAALSEEVGSASTTPTHAATGAQRPVAAGGPVWWIVLGGLAAATGFFGAAAAGAASPGSMGPAVLVAAAVAALAASLLPRHSATSV